MNKPKLSAISIRRLRRVREAILKEPLLYDQDCPFVIRLKPESCGTAGCILGWANTLFPIPSDALVFALREDHPFESPRFHHGAARLRLTGDQAYRLWDSDKWPRKFRDAETDAFEPSMARARNAAKRITHFIKTGGEE